MTLKANRTAPLTDIMAFLLDMDGTVYLGNQPIEGAVEFVAYLRKTGRQCLFFTNNSSRDATEYSQKLSEMGIEATPADILTSGEATARYLATEMKFRTVFVVGTPSFESELKKAGLNCVQDSPDAVVLGFDRTLTYDKLERASVFLQAGIPYFAANPDLVCPTEYGSIPDCGSMAALLEAATGRTPLFLGKPNPTMVRMAAERLSVPLDQIAMVGDRTYTDMEMAYRAGITSILVLTGEATAADVKLLVRKPEYVFESVAELHKALASADRA